MTATCTRRRSRTRACVHAREVRSEDAVEEQRVEMDIEIQSAPEALDDRHRARSPGADARAAGAVPLEAQQHAHGHGEHPPRQPVIPREPVPQPVRQAQHPTGARAPTAAPRPPAEPRARSSAGRTRSEAPPLAPKRHRRSSVHSVHRRRATPGARTPRVRKSRNSCSTKAGSGRPSACRRVVSRKASRCSSRGR
jgi:hypothetical protein